LSIGSPATLLLCSKLNTSARMTTSSHSAEFYQAKAPTTAAPEMATTAERSGSCTRRLAPLVGVEVPDVPLVVEVWVEVLVVWLVLVPLPVEVPLLVVEVPLVGVPLLLVPLPVELPDPKSLMRKTTRKEYTVKRYIPPHKDVSRVASAVWSPVEFVHPLTQVVTAASNAVKSLQPQVALVLSNKQGQRDKSL